MTTHFVLLYYLIVLVISTTSLRSNIIQLNTHTSLNVQQSIHYVCRFLLSRRKKSHLHCLNWPFEDNHNTHVALSENEFDTPGLSALKTFRWMLVKIRTLWEILRLFNFKQELQNYFSLQDGLA